jgi:hypothetical protein
MQPEYKYLILLQVAITIIGAVFSCLMVSLSASKSLVFGSLIALMSTLILAVRLKQGRNRENLGAEWALQHAYRTAIERYVWTVIMLGIGFGLLKLAPIWMLAGFLLGQVSWIFVPIWMKLRN